MAAPTATASLDKTAYVTGETMTLTISYADADQRTATQTITVEDSAGNDVVITTTAVINPQGLTVTVQDVERTFTKVSDTGAVAVYTATA